MYFSVPNPVMLLILPLILYGLGIVLISSLVAIFFNKVIRRTRKVNVVMLLRSASVGLGTSLIVAFVGIAIKALFWKEVNLFYSAPLQVDWFTLLFLYLPLTAILLSVFTSAFKQI
jgi:hypothetical protein